MARTNSSKNINSSLKGPLNQDKYFFNHKEIENRISSMWINKQINIIDLKNIKNKFYNLMMFPYPSAEGLHVGNMYAFTGSDIFGRFKRMQGLNVFEPIGLDGFGIHSENYALKISQHPMDQAQITKKNFYNQLHKIGAMYDWSKTLETYDPEYYKWTQWLFIQMFKHGLAYRGNANVNFCPSCKTVLADEQVIDGKCERCGNLVEKRLLEQWFLRITAYAEKLLSNISNLKWSQTVKTAQINWIGKKEGINITYPVVNKDGEKVGNLICFTTRPDTNFGATFVVLSPEHPFINQINKALEVTTASQINEYKQKSIKLPDMERSSQGRQKTGIFTGLYCLNKLNNYKMPLYVSDFVLMSVGTGAVVGIPGHDKRDFEFAKVFNLPIIRVVVGKDGDSSDINKIEQVQEENGIMINSEFLNNLDIHEATIKIMDYLEEKGWGKRVSNYHLRDWLISRQRYWGPPIPMIYCQKCAEENKSWFTKLAQSTVLKAQSPWEHAGWYPVPVDQLPVILPRIDDYKPGDDGIAPLAKHKEFYETSCPGCGGKAVRETDVSDTFLDSSWYFLRYPSVRNNSDNKNFLDPLRATDSNMHDSQLDKSNIISSQASLKELGKRSSKISLSSLEQPFDPVITKVWLPVDMYTGGAEHSVLHLLYSRFITMALNDFGYLDFDEPFKKFYAHGLVIKDGAKMSKSKGNVVNPDEYIETYGADALRLYLMFMGPFSEGGDFRDSAMEGMSRWIKRIWKMAMESLYSRSNMREKSVNITDVKGLRNNLDKLIKAVGDDLEGRRYNTAIAKMMEFTNSVKATGSTLPIELLKKFLLILAPLAPYITEELWLKINSFEAKSMNRGDSIHHQKWPTYDASALHDAIIHIIIQVNGKLRDELVVPVEKAGTQDHIEVLARKSEKVAKWLEGKEVLKVIFVPKKLINFVLK